MQHGLDTRWKAIMVAQTFLGPRQWDFCGLGGSSHRSSPLHQFYYMTYSRRFSFDFLLMKGHVMVNEVCAEFFSFLFCRLSTDVLALHYLQTDDILKTLFEIRLLRRNDRICGSLSLLIVLRVFSLLQLRDRVDLICAIIQTACGRFL
jgi:hypothetical protein